MDAAGLISPANPLGYPAPYWFMLFFKVLGFTLHMVPMNLWYAGILAAMLLRLSRDGHARRLSARLMSQMPFIIAFGVNLGIVPLLFIQAAYYRVFYSATILMAWWWLAIIGLVCVAYYAIYAYAVGLRVHGADAMPRWQVACGWLASALFIVAGFVFHNAWTLLVRIADWPELAQRTGVDAALLGTALNTGDPTLWPRMLFFFGLALTTTAAWFVFDSGWLAGRESADYRASVPRIALPLNLIGVAVYGVGGLWYATALDPAARAYLAGGALLPLSIAAAVFPLVPLVLVWLQRRGSVPALAMAGALAQFAALGLHAVVRQALQNWQLAKYMDVAAEPVTVQWSPLLMFLISFVFGLGLIFWMLSQVAASGRREVAELQR